VSHKLNFLSQKITVVTWI